MIARGASSNSLIWERPKLHYTALDSTQEKLSCSKSLFWNGLSLQQKQSVRREKEREVFFLSSFVLWKLENWLSGISFGSFHRHLIICLRKMSLNLSIDILWDVYGSFSISGDSKGYTKFVSPLRLSEKDFPTRISTYKRRQILVQGLSVYQSSFYC